MLRVKQVLSNKRSRQRCKARRECSVSSSTASRAAEAKWFPIGRSKFLEGTSMGMNQQAWHLTLFNCNVRVRSA